MGMGGGAMRDEAGSGGAMRATGIVRKRVNGSKGEGGWNGSLTL
jgi:hypothetical protein